MGKIKEVGLSIDYLKLYNDLNKKSEEQAEEKSIVARSTIFSLGSDPRVGTRYKASAPTITRLEVRPDNAKNPYVRIHWNVNRSDIDSGGVVGFAIFRRKLTEVERISLGGVVSFNTFAFDRISRKNKKTGTFSEERKALYNIRRGATPASVLNINLDTLKNKADARILDPNVLPDELNPDPAEFERFLADKDFEKIGYIDYTFQLANEKAKFEGGILLKGREDVRFDSGGTSVQVNNRDFATLFFDDSKVGFQEGFEYYVASVTKEIGDPLLSNFVKVLVENTAEISGPLSLIAKQVNETSIQLSVTCEPNDNVSDVLIYRRADDEISFRELARIDNITDFVSYTDTDTVYAKTYTYRVFLFNIHNVLSQPKEITVFSSAHRVLAAPRSNNLKIPIITATQDQNSDAIRIQIFPNDPNILFYELKRRDSTINERSFRSPSKLETNYGKTTGWENNKFFVEKKHEAINTERTKITFNEIVFLDSLVYKDHIYQYQVRGYDIYGNPTSYALSTVRAEGKKSLRAPINFRSKVIRGFPLRIKLTWDDDNVVSHLTSPESVFSETVETESVKIAYILQRRALGQTTYESFPLTANSFAIDEAICPDAIKFQSLKVKDDFVELQDNVDSEFDIDRADEIRRSFKLPNFLKDNGIYFYRVAAVSSLGEKSNFSPEFEVRTLQDLSAPVNFQVIVENTIISPAMAKLTWDVEPLKAKPDHWLIERRVDSPTDSFAVIGRAYFDATFLDKKVLHGNQYIYRIRSVDLLGRQSNIFETRLTL